MHPSPHLFKLFAAIILTTFQSCFFNKGAKQSLAQQTPNYTVSLSSSNPTSYFEAQKIPIDLLFAYEDQNIKDNEMGLRIKNISIAGVTGYLETEKGDLLEDGFDFVYKGEDYPLFFVPESGQDDGHCQITLETLLIDKYGKEAPESSYKIANCQLYICHKATEEAPFRATLTPLTEDYFCYKSSKWTLDITSDLDDKSPYKIIDLQLEQGILKIDDCELKVGDELSLGKQELVFVPNGFVGKFSPKIVIENSQLRTTTVSLEKNGYVFQDAGFFASANCGQDISLTVGGKHVPSDEEWILADWSFEGGVTGNLYDASNSNQMAKPFKLQAGTTYIECAADIQHLSGTPIIVLSIVHPDGKKETIRVDISGIVLSALETKLSEYKRSLSHSIAPETDLGSRKQTIRQSKEIITQMGYLLGEEVKTKVASIIDGYRFFLKENKAAFHQTIRLSEIASRAATSLNHVSSLTDNKEALFLLKQEQKAITLLLGEVDQDPGSFSHLASSMQTIRAYLCTINDAIQSRERATIEQDDKIAKTLEASRNQNAALELDLQKSHQALDSLKAAAIENEKKAKVLLFLKDKTAEEIKMAIGKLIQADDIETLDDLFDEIGANCMAVGSKENIRLIDYAISCRSKKVIGYLLEKGAQFNQSVIYDYLKNKLQYFDKIDYEMVELLLAKGAVLDHHLLSDIYIRHSDFKKVYAKYSHTCSNYSCKSKESRLTALHYSLIIAKLNNYKIDPFAFLVKQGANQSAILYIDWECGKKDNFDIYDLKS